MKLTSLFSALLLATSAIASPAAEPEDNFNALIERALGSKCKAKEGAGKCAKSASCGGITYNGLCPKDPASVKCCVEIKCSTPKGKGLCRSRSRNGCSGGGFVSGHCPGTSDIACCVKGIKPQPAPKPKTPKIPTNKCKKYVINSGYKILAKFPGLVKTVYCYANKAGEHGKGRALDLMVKPHAKKGRDMAEWSMNNAKNLNVLYVIWEQRIWNTKVDKKPKPWSKWRKMENRGSCTANHCDHVHISFN